MASNPLTPPEIRLHRERILEELGRLRVDRGRLPTPIEVEKLFNRAAFVANKANHLARALEEPARQLFIPVHPSAVEVVAAVKRKSADSPDGLKISFDLFKDAVEAMQRFRKEAEPMVKLSRGIEPDSVLTKRITKLRVRVNLALEGGEEEEDLLELLVSQFILLFLAHELQKPFEGEDHLQLAQTWKQKQEGGSEIVIALHVLIGLVIQMIIMGLNDDLMEKYLEESAAISLPRGVRARDLIAQARGLEPRRSMQLAEMHAAKSDYEIILEYSRDYLRKHLHEGFEMWMAYLDVVQSRYIAQSLWVHAPHYSIPHALQVQQFKLPRGRRNRRLRRAVRRQLEEAERRRDRQDEIESLEYRAYLLESLAPLSNLNYDVRNDALDGINSNLDLVAQVLSSDFALEVACCLGHVIGSFPRDALETIRAFLDGLLRATTFDIRRLIDDIFSNLTGPSFIDFLALEASAEIDKIFHRLTKKVLGLFGDDWEALLCCPLLGEMIQQVLKSIIRLENELQGAVGMLYTSLEDKISSSGRGDMRERYSQMYEQRTLRKMILIIDSVLEIGLAMDACDGDRTYPQQIRSKLRDSINLPVIEIESGVRGGYFFTALPQELESGKLVPALGEQITSLAADAYQDAAGRIKGKHTCGETSQDDIDKAISGFGGT